MFEIYVGVSYKIRRSLHQPQPRPQKHSISIEPFSFTHFIIQVSVLYVLNAHARCIHNGKLNEIHTNHCCGVRSEYHKCRR